ncbi:hypothetical protein, partial [Archaeoglobus sp.]
ISDFLYFRFVLSFPAVFAQLQKAAISSEAASTREAVEEVVWMGYVICPVCGNVGCFEIVNASYSARKAVEYMQCCKCGSIVKIVLEV